jgi:dihydrofolate reductase
MYQTMAGWETDPSLAAASSLMRDFAEQWQAADKIVYSRTLTEAVTSRTRIEHDFDAEAVRTLKQDSARDLLIAGPGLASEAIRAGLVDEYQMFVVPAVIGGGTRSLPANVRLALELLDERRFSGGTVYLRYAARP